MLAARWHQRADVRVEEVPDPGAPATGRAVLRVLRCGVCGSDVREYRAGPVLIPFEPHPLTHRSAPVILGHEILGEVVAVGDRRDEELLGGRVVVDPSISCGRCASCRRGEPNLCAYAACLGVSADGGLASLVEVDTAKLVPVPDSLSDDRAALAEPLAVALHAVSRGSLRLGERVVVSGFGPIGAGATLAAMADGASEVVVLEPDADRRRMASELGAHAVDPADAVAVREFHGFADAGFECSGADGALRTALRLVRPGGRVVVPGVAHAPAELNLRNLVLTERSVVGSVGYGGDIDRAVTLMASGVIDPTILSGPTISLQSLPRWFASTSPAAALKVLVDPSLDRSTALIDVKSNTHHDADEVP